MFASSGGQQHTYQQAITAAHQLRNFLHLLCCSLHSLGSLVLLYTRHLPESGRDLTVEGARMADGFNTSTPSLTCGIAVLEENGVRF